MSLVRTTVGCGVNPSPSNAPSPSHATLVALIMRAGIASVSRLPSGLPIPLPRLSRTHLPALCRDLHFTHGAEIGVWKGAYSATFCVAAPAMHLLCVDPWARYDGWDDGKNSSDAAVEAAYQLARQNLSGHNATIVRTRSEDAAKDVPDGSLDFVYIDGNHQEAPVLADLTCWVPKVRSGGIVAGHDYRIFADKPYIQVVPAVNAFTQAHGIDPWFLTAADKTPSYLWIVR